MVVQGKFDLVAWILSFVHLGNGSQRSNFPEVQRQHWHKDYLLIRVKSHEMPLYFIVQLFPLPLTLLHSLTFLFNIERRSEDRRQSKEARPVCTPQRWLEQKSLLCLLPQVHTQSWTLQPNFASSILSLLVSSLLLNSTPSLGVFYAN